MIMPKIMSPSIVSVFMVTVVVWKPELEGLLSVWRRYLLRNILDSTTPVCEVARYSAHGCTDSRNSVYMLGCAEKSGCL